MSELRRAAEAVVAAWDDQAMLGGRSEIAELRAALTAPDELAEAREHVEWLLKQLKRLTYTSDDGTVRTLAIGVELSGFGPRMDKAHDFLQRTEPK